MITDIENQLTTYQWIPCSNRLPIKGLRVLMQLDNAWQIVGWYDKEDKQWFQVVWGDPVANDRVLAWMELPQPYEEAMNDDKTAKTAQGEDKVTKEKIDIITDFNYLWGLSVAMAKVTGFSEEEIDSIGDLFVKINNYLLGAEEE